MLELKVCPAASASPQPLDSAAKSSRSHPGAANQLPIVEDRRPLHPRGRGGEWSAHRDRSDKIYLATGALSAAGMVGSMIALINNTSHGGLAFAGTMASILVFSASAAFGSTNYGAPAELREQARSCKVAAQFVDGWNTSLSQ